MKVKILVPGRYNDKAMRSVERSADDEHETSPAYAFLLVQDGLAEYIEDDSLPVETQRGGKPAAAKGQKRSSAGKKAEAPSAESASVGDAPTNPFVG